MIDETHGYDSLDCIPHLIAVQSWGLQHDAYIELEVVAVNLFDDIRDIRFYAFAHTLFVLVNVTTMDENFVSCCFLEELREKFRLMYWEGGEIKSCEVETCIAEPFVNGKMRWWSAETTFNTLVHKTSRGRVAVAVALPKLAVDILGVGTLSDAADDNKVSISTRRTPSWHHL